MTKGKILVSVQAKELLAHDKGKILVSVHIKCQEQRKAERAIVGRDRMKSKKTSHHITNTGFKIGNEVYCALAKECRAKNICL